MANQKTVLRTTSAVKAAPRQAQASQYASRGASAATAKSRKSVPVKKNKRKERDYFFVMRRGVCFFIMVLCLVWVAILVLNYLAILPDYTSFLIRPDYTPIDERLEVETGELDEDGNAIVEEYADQTSYIGFIDPVYGALRALAGLEFNDENGNSQSPVYDEIKGALSPAEAVEAEAADEEEEDPAEEDADEEETEETGDAKAEDGMYSIAAMVFEYFPALLILSALAAVIMLILAFLSLFGRRIFKGFFWFSLVMTIAGVATLLAGLVAMGYYEGNPSFGEDGAVISILNLSRITDFLFGAFAGAPETALDPEVDAIPPKVVAGYGLLVVAIVPLVSLILSLFAKKKVPYSIFDK